MISMRNLAIILKENKSSTRGIIHDDIIQVSYDIQQRQMLLQNSYLLANMLLQDKCLYWIKTFFIVSCSCWKLTWFCRFYWNVLCITTDEDFSRTVSRLEICILQKFNKGSDELENENFQLRSYVFIYHLNSIKYFKSC